MRLLALATAAALTLVAGCRSADYDRALPEGADALLPLPRGWARPDVGSSWTERGPLLAGLERSIAWLRRPHAPRFFPQAGIDHDRVLASCVRLAELLESSRDAEDFERAFDDEFEVYVSAGWNGRGGGVLFTAYYTPIFEGSKTQTGAYRYPLYGRPADLLVDADGVVLGLSELPGQPYPSRRAIEKFHLLAERDLELVWLRDPLDAYLCHVQGSAVIDLVDGGQLRLGFGGTNGREYTSLAAELVADGKLDKGARGIPAIRAWAAASPIGVEEYLHRNERYVFFTPIQGTPHGSLDFPVEPLVSLATDKAVFPRAAPVFVDAELSTGTAKRMRAFERIMLDQDTGGGIRTAGRGDIYIGVGDEAGQIAGRTSSEGQLYYLFLREELVPLYAR